METSNNSWDVELIQGSSTKTYLLRKMPLQVLALRVLATRQVLREKLDYKEHLVGNTRLELDALDRLPGRFLGRCRSWPRWQGG